jgi:GTP-binding protein LepA
MEYTQGEEYILNLIDSWPRGFRVKFLDLLPLAKGTFVDAAQSIQAQTISNLYLAENDLEIIPVLNKVDLQVQSEEVSDDIVDLLGCKLGRSFMRQEKLV